MRAVHLATTVTSLGAAAATALVPATARADTTPASTCAPLPSYVDGRPANLHARGVAGDYLWHDAAGWHLRVTHRNATRMVFRGVVVASAPISFQRVRDEAQDHVALSSDRTRMTFRFVNHGGIDGVDFADSCASTTRFALVVDGRPLPLARIFVGRTAQHPAHNPFVVARLQPQPAA